MKKPDIYYTRSRDGYTFRVVIDGHMIQIFSAIPGPTKGSKSSNKDQPNNRNKDKLSNSNMEQPGNTNYEMNPALFFKNVNKIWIVRIDDHTSTILFSIHRGEYVFVGDRVLKFKPLSKIRKFKSDGHYDAWALDDNNNHYLLGCMVYIMPVDSFMLFKSESKKSNRGSNVGSDGAAVDGESYGGEVLFAPHKYLINGENGYRGDGVVNMTCDNCNMEILVDNPYICK